MTQVVTVSAHTAAYAMEALKPPVRVSRKTFVEENARVTEANVADTAPDEILRQSDVIKAASAELAMMNFGDHPPHASTQEAIEAYRRAGE